MDYYFVTKVNDLTINSAFARGKMIHESMRISNGYRNFLSMFDDFLFKQSVGANHYIQFENSVYIYETGKYEDLVAKVGNDHIANYYLDFLMRKAQHFITCLWLIKDNCAYVVDGFLLIKSDKNPEESRVVHNTMSFRPTEALREMTNTVFTTEEIDEAITHYNNNPVTTPDEDIDWHIPTLNPLTKGQGRIGRAQYFALLARSSVNLPVKILNNCTVLECLFTSDNSEVTHKVAERFAFLYGKNANERKEYFKLVKDAYKIRLKTAHGQSINHKENELELISQRLDEAVRLILNSY